jgi:hypothetical protein
MGLIKPFDREKIENEEKQQQLTRDEKNYWKGYADALENLLNMIVATIKA